MFWENLERVGSTTPLFPKTWLKASCNCTFFRFKKKESVETFILQSKITSLETNFSLNHYIGSLTRE